MFFDKLSVLKENGKRLSDIFILLEDFIKPGVTTFEIDKFIEKKILNSKGRPSFKGYMGFPNAACISFNDEVVHGIPSKRKIVSDGDILSVDIGYYKNSMHVDAARTFLCGDVASDRKKLVIICKESFFRAIDVVKPGDTIGDIGFVIQSFVELNGFSVIRDLVGHGIGEEVHMEPQVPNYGKAKTGEIIEENMVLAIEPMIAAGHYKIKTDNDGWTIRTFDGKDSAHYENTVVFKTSGNEILTQ